MYGSIRKTSKGYEATYERMLKHPPEKVWKAITDPAHIGEWFVRTELEPRVGGRIVEHHDHVGLSMSGRVTRFDPPRAFAHTWEAEDSANEPEASILWEIHPDGNGSRLVMTYWLRSLDGAEGELAGWHICLDVLSAVLDGAHRSEHGPPRGTFTGGQLHVEAPGTGLWAGREELDRHYGNLVKQLTNESR